MKRLALFVAIVCSIMPGRGLMADEGGHGRYVDSDEGITIDFPDGWQFDDQHPLVTPSEVKPFGVYVLSADRSAPGTNGPVASMILLHVTQLGQADARQITEDAIAAQRAGGQRVNDASNVEFQFANGRKGRHHEASGTTPDGDAMMLGSWLIPRGNAYFGLIFVARLEWYHSLRDEFTAIARSATVTDLPTDAPQGLVRHALKKYGYSVALPEPWQFSEADQPDAALDLTAGLPDVITCTWVDRHLPTQSLEDAFSGAADYLSHYVSNVQVGAPSSCRTRNADGLRASVAFTVGAQPMRGIITMVLHNGVIYTVFSATTRPVESHLATFSAIGDSLVVP